MKRAYDSKEHKGIDMSEAELLQILARGEDSQHQFKSDITNADALAAELIALANMDTQGRIWVKSGADKRHVTAREEMRRLFQQSGLLQADQVPVRPVIERVTEQVTPEATPQVASQVGTLLTAMAGEMARQALPTAASNVTASLNAD